MKKIFFLLLVICLSFNNIFSQAYFPEKGEVFVDSIVPRIDIFINPDTLAWIYDNPESYHEFHATFIFNNGNINDTIYDVGFRLRGNTSRWAQKKSFKVSFNSFDPGRKFYGLEKMNLNGEHNDPSVIRSKLCWDLFHDFKIPAPRSNHVEVYINHNYYGLYINVEHIDENFVLSRFGNNQGNLYKCLWPADLDYLGPNPDDYKLMHGDRRVYELKTNKAEDDYSDLAHLIQIINNTPQENFISELDKVFNVYDYLKIIAIDIITGNWDGYIYNKNNFYLYKNTKTGKFEYIPYDTDNTFGIDWMNISWATRDIYQWQQGGDEVRPLYTRLMNTPEFRDQYSYYLKKFINEYSDDSIFFPKIDKIKNMILPYVENDPFYPLDYGFTTGDFINSYVTALGGHVPIGLKTYISLRNTTALQQIIQNNISPIIKYINDKITPDKDLQITAFIEDDDDNPEVNVLYKINDGSIISEEIFDDGEHGDGYANDNFYGGLITNIPVNSTISYQISASDIYNNNSIMPFEPIIVQLFQSANENLFINEFLASNDNNIADDFGEYDDWIEIFNADENAVWLGDKYLSDNFDKPDKWQLPDVIIQPGEFILIWADNDNEQGQYHTNFKLDKDGEEIGIFDSETTGYFLLDSVVFNEQSTDISFGRNPDGGINWMFYNDPTPGISNLKSDIKIFNSIDKNFIAFPNPVDNGMLYFNKTVNVRIFNSLGQLMISKNHIEKLDVDILPKGFYLILTDEGERIKIIKN